MATDAPTKQLTVVRGPLRLAGRAPPPLRLPVEPLPEQELHGWFPRSASDDSAHQDWNTVTLHSPRTSCAKRVWRRVWWCGRRAPAQATPPLTADPPTPQLPVEPADPPPTPPV